MRFEVETRNIDGQVTALGAGGALPARQEGRLTPAAPHVLPAPPRLRRLAASPHGPVWLKGQSCPVAALSSPRSAPRG